MWTRKELKTNAKAHFKANYAASILTSLVVTALTACSVVASKGDTSSEDIAAVANEMGISAELLLSILIGALGFSIIIGLLLKLLVVNPVKVGAKGLFIQNANGEKPSFLSIFGVYKTNFGNVGVTMFLKDLFIGLWCLLLVVPGIVKALEYRMVDYILAENPSTTWSEAKKLSSQMTKGHKWNIFVLDLSFFGWYILNALTCGILGILYVYPYVNQTDAELYKALKAQ